MNRNMLSPQERKDYDALVFDATHHPDGSMRKSSEIGVEFRRLLVDAQQAGHEWAAWVLDDALIDGLRARGVKWSRSRDYVETPFGGKFVRKPDRMAVARKEPGTGEQYQQQTAWADMTRGDLHALIDGRLSQINAERATIQIARKLLELLDRVGVDRVAEALDRIGASLEDFLKAGAA